MDRPSFGTPDVHKLSCLEKLMPPEENRGFAFHAEKESAVSRPILNFNARSMPGRWKKAIAAAGRVAAFSPYITNSAATEAMEAKGPACELYTVVTFEVYAAGASKIGCLKRLMAAKVRVYHLETLHAKILLIPRKAVTIGSQNMTVGSSGNQESTVIWLDEKAAVEMEKEVESWRKRGKLVTDALVRNLERKLKAFQKQHAAWKKATKKATDDLWAEWEREEEARKQREAEEAAAAARRAQSVEREEEARKRRDAEEAAERGEVQRCAKEIVSGELREDSGGWSLSNQDQYNPPSYCEWIVDGERKRLTRGFWYPCYHLDTHQWGKARVYMGCISFIDRNMGICNLRTHECQIECRNSEVDPQYNFQLGLSFGSNEANLLGRYEIERS